jgi:hypothetical protein
MNIMISKYILLNMKFINDITYLFLVYRYLLWLNCILFI